MLTLSYGYKKPENGDTGDAIFPAMAENIQRLNDHTHNGINSSLIPPVNYNVPAGSWTIVALGIYSQVVNLGSGLWNQKVWQLIDDTDGSVYSLDCTCADNQNVTIFTNDNSKSFILRGS